MIDITMPRLSDSMKEAVVLKWLIEDGEPVSIGDDLVEVETDKATMTYAAEVEGILEIVSAEGETVPVDELIARVGPLGEASGAASRAPASEFATAPAVVDLPPAFPATATQQRGDGVVATPLARRVAVVHGVSLDYLAGTGPRGRIVRSDVLKAAGLEEAPALRTALPRASEPAAAESTDVQPSPCGEPQVRDTTRMQQLIARRMVESTTTVPHFQVETEVAMDAVIELRARVREVVEEGDVVPSLNDLIVKAAALALRRHPRANGTFRNGAFELHRRVNVGVAVAAEDALIVPTVFDADAKSISGIARDVRELAGRVRAGRIEPADLDGGTFTVSNLGMYGMTAISAVINVPQAAILGVGALRQTIARVEGEIVDRTLMTLRLSCDHRILYGADAARFLADTRALLEAPLRMLL